MYDVITVCAGRDLDNIGLVLKSINNCFDVNNIFVITNETDRVPKINNVIPLHDFDIIDENLTKKLKEIGSSRIEGRFGWYYQQFLKMEFSRSKYCTGDYLIWDADTVAIKKIIFVQGDTSIVTKGHEKLNLDYVNTYKKLLNIDQCLNFSVISQHLFVRRFFMISLIDEIEKNYNSNCYISILENLMGDGASLFSEYETYVNYIVSRNASVLFVDRKWFRNGAAIVGFSPTSSALNLFFGNFDYVALEKFDTNFKGRVKGFLRYALSKLKF